MKTKNQPAASNPDQGTGEAPAGDPPASDVLAPALQPDEVIVAPPGPDAAGEQAGATTAEPPEPQEQQGEQDGGEGGQHVHAPYGFRADGVTPRAKPGRPPKDMAAQQERDLQRARLRSVTPGTAKPKQPAPIAVTPLAVVNYQALGQTAAAMFFAGGHLMLGDEWAPEDGGEKVAVEGAFATYFKAVQMNDLPPGVALCFVLGIYGMKRATKPKIRSKLALFTAWAKDKLGATRRGLSLVTRRDQARKEPTGLEST